MRIGEVSVAGYRSLRAIRFPVGALTAFVGENGVGKTNLYRALQLLQAAAAGTLARELASEGGMESALWAGRRMANKPARIKLAVGLGAEQRAGRAQGELRYGVEVGVAYSYEVDIGVRMPTAAAFPLEPQVKEETLVFRNGRRPLTLLERHGPRAIATDEEGCKQSFGPELLASETALGALADPGRFPDIDLVRRTMLDWKFYHDFRSDRASALRQPCLAVTTPTLASDGSDLAAVFATLVHIREDTYHLDDIESSSDQIVWSTDSGSPIAPRRRQDLSFAGNVVQAMEAYASGRLAGTHLHPTLMPEETAQAILEVCARLPGSAVANG